MENEGGVKKFSVQDGPFPRSAALFRIAAVLKIADEIEAVVTVSDVYSHAHVDVAKSQVIQLLKEWPMFFNRHSDENGPKRDDWIRLSSVGYDYFTPQRCVSEGGVRPNYMDAAKVMFDQIDTMKAEGTWTQSVDEPHEKWSRACTHVFDESLLD